VLINHFIATSQELPAHTRVALCFTFLVSAGRFAAPQPLFKNLEARAVLKPPQSKRWRDCRSDFNFAKRLDCGVFTAAF
jgi:hypothetical protein